MPTVVALVTRLLGFSRQSIPDADCCSLNGTSIPSSSDVVDLDSATQGTWRTMLQQFRSGGCPSRQLPRATSRLVQILSLTLTAFACPELCSAAQRLYVAAGDHIEVFAIDGHSGELSSLQRLPLQGAGPLAVASDKQRLYVVAVQRKNSQNQPAIATLDVDDDGRLKLAHLAAVNLRPGYLTTDETGDFLAGSHYGPGRASVWRLVDGVFRGEARELALEEKAHSAVFSPDNRWLLVPATGPNKVFVNRFDVEGGTVRPHTPPFAAGPTGDGDARQPRHLVFHPSKPLVYTSNERERPGVCVWRWNSEKGTLRPIQNVVTYPEKFDGVITTADLHLTPDARFLYLSNRDITDRRATTGEDSIVGFRVDAATGALRLIGHFACEHVPRSFTIDASGNYVYVAGQGDNLLGAYRINQETGALSRIKRYRVKVRPT